MLNKIQQIKKDIKFQQNEIKQASNQNEDFDEITIVYIDEGKKPRERSVKEWKQAMENEIHRYKQKKTRIVTSL